MKFTKKIMAAAFLSSTLLLTGCGQVNIGYVDGEKVMEESPQIKSVIEENEKKIIELQEQAQKELEGKEGEELIKAQSDLQRKLQGINQAYATQLKHKFDEVLADISQKKNIDVVIESSANQPSVMKGGIDLTEEVIQKLQ